ncbi:hypothetical protein JCM19992_34290 [Thermostilla marina]
MRRRLRTRRGFTLVEVVLALAILLLSLAILVQLNYLAMRNARIAREQCTAQLACASILAQLRTGELPLESVSDSPLDETLNEETFAMDDTAWLYSVDVTSIDDYGLLSVTVTVTRDRPQDSQPVSFSMTEWMIDPETEFPEIGYDPYAEATDELGLDDEGTDESTEGTEGAL